MKVIRGKFQIDSADGRRFIEDLQGVFHDITTINGPEPQPDRTIEALISGYTLVDWQADISDLPEYEVRKINVLVGLGRKPGVEITDDDFTRIAAFAKYLENEARRVGKYRWQVNCYPVVYRTEKFGLYANDWAAMAAAGRERYPGVTFTHSSAIGGSQQGICGRAYLGGSLSWTAEHCAIFNKTYIHETIGHSIMAIGHSGDQYPAYEYGERDTWQGSSGARGDFDFNTPHLFHAGLVEENNVVRLSLGESVRTHLVQGSDDPLSLKVGENKMVLCRVRETGKNRLVSVSFFNGTVRIHEPYHQTTEHWGQTGLVQVFRAGGQEKEYSGVVVRVYGLNQYSAEVEVFNNTTDHRALLPNHAAWARPEFDAEPQIGDWCRGQWGNARWSVQGIHIGFNDEGKLVLHWLTWDRRQSGKHRWFWAVCNVNGTLAYGDLLTSDNFGRTEAAGYVEVFWYDRDHGIARGESPQMGRFAVPMTRISQAVAHPVAGYYGIGNAQGLTVSIDGDGRALAYWLLHEGREQVWRMLTGPLDSLTVYSVDGGQGLVKSDFEIKEIGTASINGNEIVAIIDGVEDRRSMQRLA